MGVVDGYGWEVMGWIGSLSAIGFPGWNGGTEVGWMGGLVGVDAVLVVVVVIVVVFTVLGVVDAVLLFVEGWEQGRRRGFWGWRWGRML